MVATQAVTSAEVKKSLAKNVKGRPGELDNYRKPQKNSGTFLGMQRDSSTPRKEMDKQNSNGWFIALKNIIS